MSCSSPFAVSAQTSSDIITTTSNMNMQGCYSLQGYSTPSWTCCLPMWAPPYPCGWHCCGGCWGGGCCKACLNWCGGYSWQYCYSVPGVELWPTLQFCGSVDMPMSATAGVGLDFSVDAPPQPYECYTVTLKACDCSCSVNGSGFTINLIPDDIALTQKNGKFSATIDLGGFSSKVTEAGVEYSVSISTSLLLCLEPVPPQGWVNVLLDVSFSASIAGVASETADFTVALPLVSVED